MKTTRTADNKQYNSRVKHRTEEITCAPSRIELIKTDRKKKKKREEEEENITEGRR
jgi:hypothetical protein